MWKYQSSDHEHISLHDHAIDEIVTIDNDILLTFNDGFDVICTHPLNDTEKSKHTTTSQIILKNAFFVGGEVDYAVEITKQKANEAYSVHRSFNFSTLLDVFVDFTVLQFDVVSGVFSLHGLLNSKYDSCEYANLRFNCSDVVFCWNDYSEDAWFEGWPTRIG